MRMAAVAGGDGGVIAVSEMSVVVRIERLRMNGLCDLIKYRML